MNKYFVKQQISNHPILTDVERFVYILRFEAAADAEFLKLIYRIEYIKVEIINEEEVRTDITSQFNQNLPAWIVTNAYKVDILDELGQPIPNPNYEPEYEYLGETEKPAEWDDELDGEFIPEPIYGENIINEDEQYLQEWAFDYFKQIVFDNPDPVAIKPLMQQYIIKDANNANLNNGGGRFTFNL